MNPPSQESTMPNANIEGCPLCPRCDAVEIDLLPRVTSNHAAWCECRNCLHVWLNRHITADSRHQELYGRD